MDETQKPDQENIQGFPDLERLVTERILAGSRDVYGEVQGHTERQVISQVLGYTGGNLSQAAQILGITRARLRNKIRALGIVIKRSVSIEGKSEEA